MAYLGRISAVLTANTTAFRREIGDSRRELLNFARQARGTQFNLDNRALNGTLTNLQRFRAELRAIRRLQAEGVGVDLPNPRRLRDQFRLFEDLGKPLTEVKNRIEGLSNSIQTELYPELEAIQRGFQRVYRAIDEGSTTFNRSAGAIDNLRQRLIGLSRATAALADLNSLSKQLSANNSGASFFTPRAQEALQRSLALRSQAQQLPARFREGAFADLAVQAEENAERIERAAARVARAQLRIITEGENPDTLTERGRRQSELDVLTRQQRGINLGFEREIASAQIQQIVAPDAPRQADRLIERVRSLASELRAIDGNRFNTLIASTAAVVDQFSRGEASANRARAAVDRLAQSLEAAGRVQAGRQIGRDLQEQADQLLFSERERRQRKIQSAFDTATANVPAGDPRRRRAELDRDITLRRDQLVSEIIPRTTGLADQARQTGDQQAIRSAAELLQVNRQINNELTKSANLASQNKYDESEASLRRVNSLLQRQSDLEGDIAGRVDISNAARRQTQLFLEQSGGLGEQLSQGARDAASDISVGRQFRGGIRDGGARIAIANEINRIEASVEGLQRRMAEVAASDLGAGEKIAELNRLDNEVRESTSGLAEFIATRSRGAYSTNQIGAAMDRGRNSAGSIGVGGVASAQLAFQQGLFAVDDFISSTGGLEYKLRAIGNNITQLGLLLGQSGLIPGLTATTGLFVSLGVVLAGQAAVGFVRWITGAEAADDQTKALNDSLSKQKSLADRLAQSFESLGNSISQRAFSAAERSARDFAKSLEEIKKQQTELRTERFSAIDPGAFSATRQAAGFERRLGEATDAGQALALAEAAARRRVAGRNAAAAAAGRAPDISDAINAIGVTPRSGDERLRRALALFSDSARNAILPVNPITPFFRSRAAGITDDREARRRLEAARGDRAAEVAAVEARRDEIRQLATQDIGTFEAFFRGDSSDIAKAQREFAALTQALTLLNDAAKSDEGLIRFLKSSNDAASGIEAAQEQVAEAIRAGVPGAVLLQSQLNKVAAEIDGAQKSISKANEEFQKSEQTPTDRRRLDEAVSAAQQTITNSSIERARLEAEGNIIARNRVVDSQSLFESRRGRAMENLQAAGLESGATARRIRELDAYRARLESDLARDPSQAGRIETELQATRNEMAAIEATTMALRRFTEAISRAEQEARSNLDSARQREEDVRRQSLAPAGLATQADRRQAERDLEEQRQANQRVEDAASRARLRIEREANDPNNPLAATFARLREIEELAQGGQLTDGLIEERRRLQRQVDAAVQQDASVVAARDASTSIEERQSAAQRGRDLLLRPGEREARELRQELADINAAFEAQIDALVEAGNGVVDRDFLNQANDARKRRDEAASRALRDDARAAAPGLFALADSVQNAILQGPSRAALVGTDVSTSEGQRELYRLMRGDDPSKDENLVELRKQSDALSKLVAAAEEEAKARGIVLDLN